VVSEMPTTGSSFPMIESPWLERPTNALETE